MSLIKDTELAASLGLKFKVSRKEARSARWQTVEDKIDSLKYAIEKAKAVDDYESCVFTRQPSGGFMYWTSQYPDLLNSVVIRVDPEEDMDLE